MKKKTVKILKLQTESDSADAFTSSVAMLESSRLLKLAPSSGTIEP